MPIFEYKCKKCGTVFEFLARAGQKPVCPACKSRRLEKLISAFNAGAEKRKCPSGGSGCCGGRGGCAHGAGCCCGG